MNDSYVRRYRSKRSVALLCGGIVLLNACGSQHVVSSSNSVAKPATSSAELDGLTGSSANSAKDAPAASRSADTAAKKLTAPVAQKPQLIKTAELSLKVETIDSMMLRLKSIVRSKQGDIYNFQDDRPQQSGQHRSATLVLKIPSAVLDETVTELAKLGRIESQAIKSEDVSQQLVDTDARLKNLRQQEDLTRKIMDRSGSVKDILAVSQELASIREQIEQLDATVKNLRQQVAYSTINLTVAEIKAAVPTNDAFGVRVQETWKDSTNTAGSLMTNLALGLLWLLPFAPFLAIGVGGVYYIVRRRRQISIAAESSEPIDLGQG